LQLAHLRARGAEHVAHELEQEQELRLERCTLGRLLVEGRDLLGAEVQRPEGLGELCNLGRVEVDALLLDDVLEGGDQRRVLQVDLVVLEA
jgi:hypothetical protein